MHRDLNPGNLFLAQDAVGHQAQGARLRRRQDPRRLGARHGPGARARVGNVRMFAPAYGAPEQFDENVGAIGPWTDVYARGARHARGAARSHRDGGRAPRRVRHEGARPEQPPDAARPRHRRGRRGRGRARRARSPSTRSERPRDAGELWGMLKHAIGVDERVGRQPHAHRPPQHAAAAAAGHASASTSESPRVQPPRHRGRAGRRARLRPRPAGVAARKHAAHGGCSAERRTQALAEQPRAPPVVQPCRNLRSDRRRCRSRPPVGVVPRRISPIVAAPVDHPSARPPRRRRSPRSRTPGRVARRPSPSSSSAALAAGAWLLVVHAAPRVLAGATTDVELRWRGDPFGLAGQLLDGQYRVERAIGEGGFSVVYRGMHQGLGEPIAIKCLKLNASLDTEVDRELHAPLPRRGAPRSTASGQGNLDIVRVIISGTTVSPATGALVPYMVLEWLEGKSLAADFKARRAEEAAGQVRSRRWSRSSSRAAWRSTTRTGRASFTATSSRGISFSPRRRVRRAHEGARLRAREDPRRDDRHHAGGDGRQLHDVLAALRRARAVRPEDRRHRPVDRRLLARAGPARVAARRAGRKGDGLIGCMHGGARSEDQPRAPPALGMQLPRGIEAALVARGVAGRPKRDRGRPASSGRRSRPGCGSGCPCGGSPRPRHRRDARRWNRRRDLRRSARAATPSWIRLYSVPVSSQATARNARHGRTPRRDRWPRRRTCPPTDPCPPSRRRGPAEPLAHAACGGRTRPAPRRRRRSAPVGARYPPAPQLDGRAAERSRARKSRARRSSCSSLVLVLAAARGLAASSRGARGRSAAESPRAAPPALSYASPP